MYVRGLEGDNSCFKFMIKFRKGKLYIFKLNFMQLFSADTKIFKEFKKKICRPQNIKKLPSKVAYNPTRPVISPASVCIVKLRYTSRPSQAF